MVFKVILIIAVFFNSCSIIFLGHLISFHVFLQKKGLSTFDYLMMKKDKLGYKSKIFREVKHDEKELKNADDESKTKKQNDEVVVEIDTDNNAMNAHKVGDEESIDGK